MANTFDQQKPIPGIKHIIAVSSGKGGVGKSTVTTNLSMALTKLGQKVGLLDADIYGPSIPRMMGALNQIPEVNRDNKLIPINRFNISLMSLGLMVEDNQAIIWRGPMLFKALEQLLRDVQWGELDYLVIDLPPGTGDVQLTLAQKVPISGAISVCTPQNVALMDVKRSLDMWNKLNVPVLGLVENMSYYLAEGTEEKLAMFPKGELNQFLTQTQIPKIGEIPFVPKLATAGEIGIPLVESAPDSPVTKSFLEIAETVIRRCP